MTGPVRSLLLTLCSLTELWSAAQSNVLLRIERSKVTFVSDAPMERIEASSVQAAGVLDAGERSFVVQLPVRSFEGFNSPLQREHFNENYMESDDHPNARFRGRIIEAVDLLSPGTYRVRAKGAFSVHGVERERIIPCDLVVSDDGARVTGTFEVMLSDHDIQVPGIVRQKIAPSIQVTLDLLFRRAAATTR